MKAYSPHERLVAAARPTKALILTITGFAAIEFLYQLGRDLLDYVLENLSPDVAAVVFEGVAPVAVLYDLYSFGILGVLVVWVGWRNHDRGFLTLFGTLELGIKDLRLAVIGAGGMHLILLGIIPWGFEYAEMGRLDHWLILLPFGLLALLVQTGAEELFYRGYLQQQLAARYRQTWVWMVVPNVAFASVHWFNGTDSLDSVYYVFWAFAFGLAASDLTARSGTLGAAIGFHLVNNAFAFMLLDTAGRPGSGLALFLYPAQEEPGKVLPVTDGVIMGLHLGVDLSVILVAWLAVRVAIRR